MRKLTQEQLEKVECADLSGLKNGEHFIIPKRAKSEFEVGKEYIIELADDLLIKGCNSVLESNYNKNKVPTNKFLHGEIESILGKLVLFSGCGCLENGTNLSTFWHGYLPKEKIKIVKKYE